MRSAIYQITNRANGKRYIGSTVNLLGRRGRHLRDLRRGEHPNQHLQSAFDKDGEDALAISVLEYVQESDKLIEREQHYLDTLKPEYNIAPVAGSPTSGRCWSVEMRRKISELWTQKRRQAQSKRVSGDGNPNYGKQRSEETKQKIGEAQKGKRGNNYGKHPSAETRTRMSKAQKGKVFREESRAKLSATWTPARRQRLADRLKGKHLSRETKRKIGLAHKGRHLTVEHRRKLSEAQKAHWRRVREPEPARE